MAMTLDQYILNPLGKTNAVLSAGAREYIRNDYITRFNNILLRENGNIKYYKYKTTNNEYIIHIKIPSEVVKKFYYDVVFRFYADEKVSSAGSNLSQYYFQAYSNDPAFVYTHAYVFRHNNLFFNDLSPKMSKIALKQSPDIKNPTKQIAYVKSLYFGYLFMKNRNLFKTIVWSDAEDYKKETLLSNVMSADEKVALRQEKEKEIDHRKKIIVDKNTAKKIHHMEGLSDKAKERVVTTTSKVPTVKKTKAVNATKFSKKTVKKI